MKKYRTTRYATLAKELATLADKRDKPTERNVVIAKKLKVSFMTVSNYISGRIKDGYLAEDILEEIKKELQPKS